MSLFAKREVRQWAPEPIVAPFPGTDQFGRASAPTIDRAMQVSAVWACVRLLADSVSMMPLHGYTIRGGIRVPTADPSLIVKPSSDATTTEWVYMSMVSLLLRGNAYGRKVARDAAGYPTQVELMDPDQVTFTTDAQTGRQTYAYNGKAVATDDMVHIRAFRMPGRQRGLSPIQYAAGQINTDTAVSAFAQDYFNNGAHPSSILTTDQVLTQTQALTAKERFMAAVKGREPALLSGGMQYAAIQVTPEESQFLETQKFGVQEIARIFGVPPEMIASTSGASMTYANVEQRALDFLTYSVQPWLTRLESAYAQLLPGQRHVRFDTSVLTRTDFETTMTATAIGIASKQMTVDEARAKRDEPPLDDAQKADLELVPLTVSVTGKPKSLPPPPPEGEPA
jgi:HK97 family phage portal protein